MSNLKLLSPQVTIQDSRTLVGTFMAFDKHMNLVLGDCEEHRTVRTKKAGGKSKRLCSSLFAAPPLLYCLLIAFVPLFFSRGA